MPLTEAEVRKAVDEIMSTPYYEEPIRDPKEVRRERLKLELAAWGKAAFGLLFILWLAGMIPH